MSLYSYNVTFYAYRVVLYAYLVTFATLLSKVLVVAGHTHESILILRYKTRIPDLHLTYGAYETVVMVTAAIVVKFLLSCKHRKGK